MTSQQLTEPEMLERIRTAVAGFGSQRAAAAEWGISEQQLSDILAGRRSPTSVAATLGYTRQITFAPPEKEDDQS